MPSWILAIDFGTSYTVAASKVGERSPEVIEIAGERRVPSVIMVDPAGAVVVGRIADDLSATHPESTLRAMKNRLGDQAPVVLDGRPHQVVALVAALLRQVYTDSVRQMGEPPMEVRLTHPATWNRPRLNRLLEAAAKAGLPNPALVPEPVAAALSFASEVGVPNGAHVVVYDLGGGTFDTAVVTSSGGGFNIVGRPSGDQNIGGELFDEIIVNHLGEQLPPDAWDAIQVGEEPLWQQVGATLRNEARKAKETLSGNPYADLIVPLPTGLRQIRITRDEFEQLVRPYLSETVTLLDRCIAEAGLTPTDLAGISLVGGSSRSPIVEQMVKQAFPQVPVIRRGDPKTAVASGAARAVRSAGPSSVSATGRSTKEASPGTANDPVRLAPPISKPSQPSQPSQPPHLSQPHVAPPHGSQPSQPQQPYGSQRFASQPSAPGSFPPAAPGAEQPRSGSYPPQPPQRSMPPGGSHPGPPSGAHGSVAPVAQPLQSGPAPTTSKRGKLLVAVGAVVAAIIAVVAVVALTGGDDAADAAQPTRQQLEDALIPIRDVRDALGNEFNAQDSGEGEPFCEQFSLQEPTRVREALFFKNETIDGVVTATSFSEGLYSYPTEAGAQAAFDQDKAISANCSEQESTFDGVPITYVLTNVNRSVSKIGDDLIAVKFVAAPDAGGESVVTGYVIIRKVGSVILSTNYEVYKRELTDDEFDKYLDLTAEAFARADEML